MHEMSLAENVREIIEQTAEQHQLTQVRKVVLEIGELAAVEVEAMRFCFDAAMQNSIAEGAELEIEIIPGQAQCGHCGHSSHVSEQYGLCEQCESPQLNIISGRQMRVKDLLAS